MGSLLGHVLPGIAFVILGLWHVLNQIKLHILHPNSSKSLPWFPTPKIRYLEPILIMIGSFISVSMELIIGPKKHQPFDVDGTIPSNHLRNFEHSSVSMFFIIYASVAIVLDKLKARAQNELTLFVGGLAFGNQLFMFHMHSTDHHGLEGQYHFALQIIVYVSFFTTLLEIFSKESTFLVSFVRSMSIIFQGFWLIFMGFMLWVPSFIPKGCLIYNDDGHKIVKCSSQEALDRAKSLVNIEFSWFLILIVIFSMSLYLILVDIYTKRVGGLVYSSLPIHDSQVEESSKSSD